MAYENELARPAGALPITPTITINPYLWLRKGGVAFTPTATIDHYLWLREWPSSTASKPVFQIKDRAPELLQFFDCLLREDCFFPT